MEIEEIKELCDRSAARIIEHVESVIIIVTMDGPTTAKEGPTTMIHKSGGGNYYAQVGSAAKWLEREHDDEIAQRVNPPKDDDGESWKS